MRFYACICYSPHRHFVDRSIYYWVKFLANQDRSVSPPDRNGLSLKQAAVCSNQTPRRVSCVSRASWHTSARFLHAGHEECRNGSNSSNQARKAGGLRCQILINIIYLIIYSQKWQAITFYFNWRSATNTTTQWYASVREER